jgi:sensor domain CHASE-containing protein
MIPFVLLAVIIVFVTIGLVTVEIFQRRIKKALEDHRIDTLKKLKNKINKNILLWIFFSRKEFEREIDKAFQIIWEETSRGFHLEELMREAEDTWKNINGLTTSESEDDGDYV